MSAFIVSDKTMNTVVNAFFKHDRQMRDAPQDQLELLGHQLFDMNADAIRARYGERDDGYDETPDYRWTPLRLYDGRAALCAMLKAAQCLGYQCSEGDVPDYPLYKRLNALVEDLSYEIISELPEYNRAEWDAA